MKRWMSAAEVVSLVVAAGCLAVVGCIADGTEARLSRGLDLLYEGRYEDAESHFLTLARELARGGTREDCIQRAQALYHAGRIEHLYLSQPRRAVARLREALKVDPNAGFAFQARGEVAFIFYDRLRDYRTAALEFERLVNAFPEHEECGNFHYRAAQCYFLLREFDQARTEARLILERYKDKNLAAESMLLVANAYYVEGRYQEAVEAHQRLLKAEPGVEIEGRSRFEMGMCLQELGHNQQAEGQFLLALKIHPRPDIIRHQIELLHERMKEEDDPAGEELPYATATRKKKPVTSGPKDPTDAKKSKPPKKAPQPAAFPKKDKPSSTPEAREQPAKEKAAGKVMKIEKKSEGKADKPQPKPKEKAAPKPTESTPQAKDNKKETKEKTGKSEKTGPKPGATAPPPSIPEKKY